MKRRAELMPAALLLVGLAGLTASPASAQDSYPLGTLSFFNLGSCPTGWAAATEAGNNSLNGYLVVPFYQLQPGQLGTTLPNVPPLASGEDRMTFLPRRCFAGSGSSAAFWRGLGWVRSTTSRRRLCSSCARSRC